MKILQFIEETKKETTKIAWLPRKELLLSTMSVFFVVGLFAIFFLFVDLVVSNFITYLLGVF